MPKTVPAREQRSRPAVSSTTLTGTRSGLAMVFFHLVLKIIQATVAGSRCNYHDTFTYMFIPVLYCSFLIPSPHISSRLLSLYGRSGSLRFPGGGKICGTEALLFTSYKGSTRQERSILGHDRIALPPLDRSPGHIQLAERSLR